MDKYTETTKDWLDKRFKKTDEDGIYFAHKPIYGFRKGHSEYGMVNRYIITYQIMKALSHLKFKSLLDVGGAEGYTTALARSIFSVDVRSCDLSVEACKRAKEIFDIDGEPIDIHQLPYDDNEFDIVICSETLEHVSNLKKATEELIRVCSKAVVITVPHEPKEKIERNIKEGIPHAHIHSLDTNSFDFTLPKISKIIKRRMLSPFLKRPCLFVDATQKEYVKNSPKIFLDIYNFFVPFLRAIFGERSASSLIWFDDFLSNLMQKYSGMIFTLLKDDNCYSEHSQKVVSPFKIIDFRVPYHHLKEYSE